MGSGKHCRSYPQPCLPIPMERSGPLVVLEPPVEPGYLHDDTLGIEHDPSPGPGCETPASQRSYSWAKLAHHIATQQEVALTTPAN